MKEFKQLELDFDGKIEAEAIAKKQHDDLVKLLFEANQKYQQFQYVYSPLIYNTATYVTNSAANYTYTYTSNTGTSGTGNWG